MSNNNKKWFKAFNNPELKEEKWLETSDALFDNISNEIFEKKKKRKLAYWLFGLASIMILLIGGFVILAPGVDLTNTAGDITLGVENNIAQYAENSTEIVEENANLSNLQESVAESKNIKNDLTTNVSTINKETTNKNDQDLKGVSENKPSGDIIKETSNYQDSKPIINLVDINSDGNLINSNALKQPSSLGVAIGKNTDKFIKKKAFLSSAPKTTLEFPKIKSLTISSLVVDDRSHPSMDIVIFDRPEDFAVTTSSKPYFLGFSFGLSQWNFNLNNNYSTALNPADFSFENGKGINAGLSFQKQLNIKWSLISSAQMEQINFVSGHNSSANYDLLKETGGLMTNDIDLTMASPLGFIESQIVVNRAQSTIEENTDLVIDLHNEHHITNLSVDAGLSYALFKSKFINVSPSVGLGANYFSSLSNELSSFDIDKQGFASGKTKITSNPQNVKKVTPFVHLGLQLDREVGNDFKTGFGISYRKTLMPIYSEGDFSTNLSTLNVRWMIAKMF